MTDRCRFQRLCCLAGALLAPLAAPAESQVPTALGVAFVPQQTSFRMMSDEALDWQGAWEFALGSTAAWEVSDWLALRIGLDYSRFSTTGVNFEELGVVRVKYDQVQVPILLESSVPTGVADLRLALLMGATAVVVTDCRYQTSEQDPYSQVPPDTWVACDDSRRAPGLDVGLPFRNPRTSYPGIVVGAELQQRVSDNVWLIGGFRGQWGLKGVDRSEIPGDWRQQLLGASIGLLFELSDGGR